MVKDLLRKLFRVTLKWLRRLFTKNTGLCKVVRRRIGADACPVPEGYVEVLGLRSEALKLSPGKRRR